MLIMICTIFALGAAGFGWWKDTRALYRRPGAKWSTDTVSPDRISSAVLNRRRRRRLMTTAEFAVYGAMAGAGLLWVLQRFAR